METETVEQETTQEPDSSEQADETVIEETESPDDAELLKEKNKKLYARAKTAEEEARKYKDRLAAYEAKLQKLANQPAEKTSSPAVPFDEIEDRVDLRLKGFTREEISYVESYAKGQGKKLREVAEDPFVLSGIDGLRAKAKVAQAIPPPSTGSLGKTKKEIPLSKMNPIQKKVHLKSVWESALAKRNSTKGSMME